MCNCRCPEYVRQSVPLIPCPRKEQRDLLFVHAGFGYEMRADRGLSLTEVRRTVCYLALEARVSSRSENVGGGTSVHYDRGQCRWLVLRRPRVARRHRRAGRCWVIA